MVVSDQSGIYPSVYYPSYISTVCRQIPGFTSEEFLTELDRLAQKCVYIIEIGCFKGRSTAVLANAVVGVVYAIDIWYTPMYDPSVLLGDGNHFDECLAYRVFWQNMRRMGVDRKIVPMIGNSHWMDRYFKPESIDLIFIDGDHAEHMVLQDIQLYLPKLRKGGVMCGDDYDLESVKRPVDAMARINGFEVVTFADGKGWRYTR